MDWDGPNYAIGLRGAAPHQHYSGTVLVMADDFDYRSPIVHASTLKGAETAAAAVALAALDPYADDILRKSASGGAVSLAALAALAGADGGERPLTALSEFSRRNGAKDRIVWYDERPSSGRFRCAAEIAAGGAALSSEGEGMTRTEAMEAAARALVAAILERAQVVAERKRADGMAAAR